MTKQSLRYGTLCGDVNVLAGQTHCSNKNCPMCKRARRYAEEEAEKMTELYYRHVLDEDGNPNPVPPIYRAVGPTLPCPEEGGLPASFKTKVVPVEKPE